MHYTAVTAAIIAITTCDTCTTVSASSQPDDHILFLFCFHSQIHSEYTPALACCPFTHHHSYTHANTTYTHVSTLSSLLLYCYNQGAGRRAKQRGERVLERTLDARQFALKMISNVTYGYTAAGFSGHMPMAELADAIVECGRATLENAIR
jgi:DNA polymerase family B